MKNFTTNMINHGVLTIFVVAPFVGYLSQTFLHKQFSTLVMPLMILSIFLMLFLRKEIRYTKPLTVLFLYVIYTMISDKFIAFREFNTSYFMTNDILGSLLILFMIDNTYFKEEYINKIFIISIIILFIAFVVIIIQQFSNSTFFVSPPEILNLQIMPEWEKRLPSIYSWIGPLWILSHCFFPVLSVVIAQLLKNDNKYVWIFYFIGAFVAFFSKSRFIFINFLILFLLIPIYKKIEIKALLRYILIIGICIVSFIIVAKPLNFNLDNIIQKRILETDRGGMTKGAAGTRILAFDIFNKLYVENPLFGKGRLHDFTTTSKDQELVRALAGRSSQIHVGYLSLFYYYGFTGGVIFLTFLGLCIHRLYHNARIHHYWGPFFGFLQLLLSNLTNVSLHIFIMGYIVCFMFDQYYTNKQGPQYDLKAIS